MQIARRTRWFLRNFIKKKWCMFLQRIHNSQVIFWFKYLSILFHLQCKCTTIFFPLYNFLFSLFFSELVHFSLVMIHTKKMWKTWTKITIRTIRSASGVISVLSPCFFTFNSSVWSSVRCTFRVNQTHILMQRERERFE